MPKKLLSKPYILIISLLVCATAGATEPPPRVSSFCSTHVVGDTVSLKCATTPRVATVDPITAGYEQLDALAGIGVEVDGETVTLNSEKLDRARWPGPTPVTPAWERDDFFEARMALIGALIGGYWSEGPVMFLVPSAAGHKPANDGAENSPNSDAETEE